MKPRRSFTVSKHIMFRPEAELKYTIEIDRKGFHRRRSFDTQPEAERWRDEQLEEHEKMKQQLSLTLG